MNLALIHWLGGFVHARPIPWNSGPDPYTLIGFHQSFLASIAFAVGSWVLAPFILRIFLRGETSPAVQIPGPDQLALPKIYLLLGVASLGVLAPLLKEVPSIFALSISGVFLTMVGVCLACWKAYILRSYAKLACWLIAVCVVPFVTIVTLGFVGYGSFFALLVFCFVATYYRPRWLSTAGLGLLIFLGLSLFVTYFRDRPLIRQKVWGGAAFSDRVETLAATLENFEFLDLRNPRHLKAIDLRLNQNYFVGRVVRTMELGQEQYAYGATLYDAVLALVPRIVWRDKPVAAGSGRTVSRYARIRLSPTIRIRRGQVLEFYINFGPFGVLAGFLIMGLLVRIMDTQAALCLYEGNWEGFMSWFLPSISLLIVGGSFVEVFGSAGASVVLVVIINKLLTIGRVSTNHPRTAILPRCSVR